MSLFWYLSILLAVATGLIFWEQSKINSKRTPKHVPRHYDNRSLDMIPYARIAARIRMQEQMNRYEAIDNDWKAYQAA